LIYVLFYSLGIRNNKILKFWCTPQLHITGLYAQTAYSAVWVPQNRSRACALCVVLLQHIFCARKNAPHFSSSGAKKRHIQPGTLCAILPKIVDKIFYI